MGNDKD